MYPIQCIAGYNVPTGAGKMTIVGFKVAVNDLTADAEFAIVDDENINASNLERRAGNLLGTLDNVKNVLAHEKIEGGDVSGSMTFLPKELIKTRNGLSIYTENVKIGSVCVYRS